LKKKVMAKSKGTSAASMKISFGKKRTGVHSKKRRPKDKPVSKYRGQGR
jgi:hypothetical protein